ncbi:MAG: hypothetical protein ABSB96_03585 [Gaiellaceae bacterium]
MAEMVVPKAVSGAVTDEAIEEFRERTLAARFWSTRPGGRLLRWFWKSWIGRWVAKEFRGAEAAELHGYAFWGPVALAIVVTEILGALSKSFRNWIPWPTISGTVGHIEDLDGRWGLAVVTVIAASAFYAVSYRGGAVHTGTKPLFKLGFIKFRYGWPLVFVMTALVALIVRLALSDEKFHLGYAIYGSFAVFGIAIPMLLVWRKSDRVVFPSLFYTFGKLRERFRWLAVVVIAGLSILILHLALYPWPNLAREPASYAGLNAYHARAYAQDALKKAANPNAKPGLVYSTEGRGISEGHNAWFVYFNVVSGGNSTYAGCVVEVTEITAKLDPHCLQQGS